MQYSNRSSYKNRNKRSFYSSKQYNNNLRYENSRYKNSEYGNSEYENSEEFDKMSIIRASQEVYYNKYSNKDILYNIEKYHENSNSQYFTDFFFII